MFDPKSSDSVKLRALARYAMAYKEAFGELSATAHEANSDATRLQKAFMEIREKMAVLVNDTNTSLRLLGSACQQIKVKIGYCPLFVLT